MPRALVAILVVALTLGLSASATSMPDGVRIPIVTPTPNRVPAAAALFQHSRHAQTSCYGCHPTLFPRERIGFTHTDMQGGRLCAACHDGGNGFAIAKAPCEQCHVPSR